jgi:glyceraldehyde-3-phosphate dehydrogenase/erythrose-4-phosphate dehydrogenase
MKNIALVGFGTIGQYLFRHMNSQSGVQVSCVYEANKEIAKWIRNASLLILWPRTKLILS